MVQLEKAQSKPHGSAGSAWRNFCVRMLTEAPHSSILRRQNSRQRGGVASTFDEELIACLTRSNEYPTKCQILPRSEINSGTSMRLCVYVCAQHELARPGHSCSEVKRCENSIHQALVGSLSLGETSKSTCRQVKTRGTALASEKDREPAAPTWLVEVRLDMRLVCPDSSEVEAEHAAESRYSVLALLIHDTRGAGNRRVSKACHLHPRLQQLSQHFRQSQKEVHVNHGQTPEQPFGRSLQDYLNDIRNRQKGGLIDDVAKGSMRWA